MFDAEQERLRIEREQQEAIQRLEEITRKEELARVARQQADLLENLRKMQQEAEEEARRLETEKEEEQRMDLAMKLEMEML